VLDRFLPSAKHQAVAALFAPDSAAGSAVHEVDRPVAQPVVPQNIVFVVRVPPIDGDVARAQVIGKLNQRTHRRFPGRQHQPDQARRLQVPYQIDNRPGRHRAQPRHVCHPVRIAIVGHAIVAAAHQPNRHIRAHTS
jgi:hypothetical protein